MRRVSGIVATAVVACAATACSSGGLAAAKVWREPAVDPGADPFTDSVQIGPVPTIAPMAMDAAAEQRDELDIDAVLGVPVAVGSDPALFGGSPGTQLCDPDQLVTLLTGDPDKAAAWGDALGVGADDIVGFVATLTPVVLTSDTLVTNHTYRDGEVTEVQSVLEAGTAVLVAAVGVPQVKCNSGNPLAEPAALDADATTFVGDEWDGFDPDEVIAVEPGNPVDTFSLLDVGTGTPFDVPAGGGPASVGVLPPPDGIDGTWTVSPDGLDDPACLGGATIVIDGTTATMSRPGVTTISGTVDGGPQATAEIAESVDGFVIHLGGEPPDEIQLVLQVTAPDGVLGSISPDCDEFVNLTRTGPGGATADPPDADTADAAGGWVAVKTDEGGSYVLTSPDGAEWHDVSVVPGVHITGLALGAGTWVAFGYTGELTVALAEQRPGGVDADGRLRRAGRRLRPHRRCGLRRRPVPGRGQQVGDRPRLHQFPVLYRASTASRGPNSTQRPRSSRYRSTRRWTPPESGWRRSTTGDGRFVIAGYRHMSPQAGWPEGAVILYELADGSDQPAVLVPWRAVGDNPTALAVAGDGRALFAATPGEPTANADAVTSSLEWLNGTSTEAIGGSPFESMSTELVAYGADGFRAIVNGPLDPGTGIPDGPAQFYSSADGVDWELLGSSHGNFRALASGPVAATATPTTAAPGATPTTTAPAAPSATAPPAPVAPALRRSASGRTSTSPPCGRSPTSTAPTWRRSHPARVTWDCSTPTRLRAVASAGTTCCGRASRAGPLRRTRRRP